MTDLLVKLYALKPVVSPRGFTVRATLAHESETVTEWVGMHFQTWVPECRVASNQIPSRCIIAEDGGKLLGFACYETTARNFFGPMGVPATHRGKGVGRALLLYTLDAMRAMGYAYAIVGGAHGQAPFYIKHAGAVVIEDSVPGIYPANPLT